MQSKLAQISRVQWMLFFCVVIITSLIYSPFVLTLGMIGLLLTAVLDRKDVAQTGKSKFAFRKDLKIHWKQFLKEPVYWIVMLFFLLPLIGGFYSADMDYLFRRLKLKLPCLLLPFAFFILPKIERRQYLGLYYYLVVILSISCVGIGVNYLLHFDAINEALLKGQAMPVPRNHIRYSLMMAIGILAGIYLYREKFVWKYPWERSLILGLTIFLFIFIHILSVRSGLAVLYISLVFFLLLMMYQKGPYLMGMIGLVLICAVPLLAYQFVPSFKAKIDYARWDFKMYMEGTGEHYSDAERMLSYQVGWSIIQDHPIIGIGTGDLKPEVYRRYAANFPDIDHPKMPHNQLMSMWGAHGIIGLVIFLVAFFYPLFYKQNYREFLFASFLCIIFLTFMIENTIENSIGLGIFIFFLLLNIKYLEEAREVE